jgi:uncharacterized protein DUF4388
VSLSGNLATFSLDEVLLLLSRTAKSGALRVRDATTEGVVYFTAGRLCGAEVDQVSGSVDDATALEARLVDTCFTLARLADGAFEFETDRRPPWTAADELEVAPVVERVRDLLARWPAIERSVPSIEVTPSLVGELHRDSVTIDRATWPVLVAVDGRSSVRSIGASLGCSALEVAASLATLVEAGAVTLGEGAHHAGDARPSQAWRGFDDESEAGAAGEEITDLESQVDALEHAAAELEHEHDHHDHHDHGFEVVEDRDAVADDALRPEEREADDLDDERDDDLGDEDDDEQLEVPALTSDGVAMLTHDPDALALLNRAELERAALGEPIEEPEAEAGPEAAPEPVAADLGDANGAAADERGSSDDALPVQEPRPAVARDRGALLRMFSSLRDG